jgi:O-antigen/teichoic acid export membrane protein
MSSPQKQVAALVTGKLTALAVTFLVPMFLARFLSKEHYGVYAQIAMLIDFLPAFFSLGLESNLYYFYPTAGRDDRKVYVIQTLVILLAAGTIAVVVLSIPTLRELLVGEGEVSTFAGNITLLTLLLIPSNMLIALYVVKKDLRMSMAFPPLNVFSRALLVVMFVIVVPGVDSIVRAWTVYAVLLFSFIVFYTVREAGVREIWGKLKLSAFKAQLKYSLPFGTAVSIRTFSQMFDKVVCISYLTATGYATYSVAFYGIPGIMHVYDPLSQVAIIQMTEQFQNGNKAAALDIYHKLVRQTYSFTVPAILIVSLYAKKIITFLFTEKFADSTPLFQVYLVTFLVLMLGAGLILRASGETKYNLYAFLISAVFTIPLTLFLVRAYGMWGALCGAIISLSAPKLSMLFKEAEVLGTNLRGLLPWRDMGRIALIALGAYIPFVLIEFNFTYGIVLSAIFGAVYVILVSLLELRYGLFVLEAGQVRGIAGKLKKRLLPSAA